MSKFLLVTTFNSLGYDLYGKKMLESFLQYWPTDQQLVVYTEGFEISPAIKFDSRIIVRDLLAVSSLNEFKTRNADNRKANGYWPDTTTNKNFLYDAVRFSHKVFALYETITNNPTGAENIVWVDGDSITHTHVPTDFLETNFAAENFGVSYLGRQKQYTECGWVVYHMSNPMMKDFWETFADYYRNDSLLNEIEWHDSYIFDVVRKQYELKGMVNRNITPGCVTGHPFINSILGDYMDHLKGPRKAKGRSDKKEHRTATGSGYWK